MANLKKTGKGKSNSQTQGRNASDINSKITKKQLKERGISNSGGQFSDQTDNKQVTINKGHQNPDVQGKRKAPKLPSKSGPKKRIE